MIFNLKRKFYPGFEEIKVNQNYYGQVFAFSTDGKIKPLGFFMMVNCVFWATTHFILFGCTAFNEHQQGRGYLFGDCLCFCGWSIFCSTCFSGLWFLKNRKNIADLYLWCENLYQIQADEEMEVLWKNIFDPMNKRVRKWTKILFQFGYGNIVFQIAVSLFFKITVGVAPLPTPSYTIDGYIQEFPYFYLLCIHHSLASLIIQCNLCFIATTFIIIEEHLSCHLDLIINVLEQLKTKDPRFKLVFDSHIDAIEQITMFSHLFSLPMLLIEGCALAAFVLLGLTVKLNENVMFGFVLVGLLQNCAIYSHFGQNLTEKFEGIRLAAFRANWIEMTHEESKKLLLMMEIAKVQRGMQAGGLHFLSYEQFTGLMRRGYNILLAIINTVEA